MPAVPLPGVELMFVVKKTQSVSCFRIKKWRGLMHQVRPCQLMILSRAKPGSANHGPVFVNVDLKGTAG